MTTWLHEQRLDAARDAVLASGARTIADLGCGDGDLLVRLLNEPSVEKIVGIDICIHSLARLRGRLDGADGEQSASVDLMHGSMTAYHPALAGIDCAILIETIEHIDPDRLSVLELSIFERMQPETVIVTTPNAEFNPPLGVPSHRFRHPDHRFEWDRARFRRWAGGVATRSGYSVAHSDIGGKHSILGSASQMAVFRHSTSPREL